MRYPRRSLRRRLVASHVAVVAVGVATLIVAGNWLAPSFIDRHIAEMEAVGGSMVDPRSMADFEQGVLTGFAQALLVAAAVSTATALAVAFAVSGRLLRPIEAIGRATRRLAQGSYNERIPVPTEEELASLVEDVNSLAAALGRTEERRMQLIGEVAHELRTPLATITGYMEGLIDDVFEPTVEVFSAIGREATRLERLASDLDLLSRSDAGQLGLELEPIDLAEVAREVAERLRPQFDDNGVVLDVRPLPDLPTEGDRDRLTQVFTNIVGNALTYTDKGGSVSISGTTSDEIVSVSVTDTGRGLSADQIDTVFERFYRADRSATGGTGVGLTIARNIVRLHAGDVEASSPGRGAGATFTVTLARFHPRRPGAAGSA